ncbi:MAG: thioredoxin family protein [Saprospiraceae bacterium]
MALTESTMMDLGTIAPAFVLPDTKTGNDFDSISLTGGKGFVVLFLCNHCPYVIHVNNELVKIANEYMEQGIQFVAISANDADNYPEDRPELMRLVAKVLQYPFPYLYDESQEVARAYDAACTPDIYVFDGESKLYYRGRLDSSRPNSGIPLSGEDLRSALKSLLKGEPTPEKQYPSAGCNIKWKK